MDLDNWLLFIKAVNEQHSIFFRQNKMEKQVEFA